MQESASKYAPDALRKREEFAISLRKKKKQEILINKRQSNFQRQNASFDQALLSRLLPDYGNLEKKVSNSGLSYLSVRGFN